MKPPTETKGPNNMDKMVTYKDKGAIDLNNRTTNNKRPFYVDKRATYRTKGLQNMDKMEIYNDKKAVYTGNKGPLPKTKGTIFYRLNGLLQEQKSYFPEKRVT